MKAKVIETGEIVNVTPNPTWYKENGQGPDRREWDEDELDFSINSKSKSKEVDLEKELSYEDYIRFFNEHPDFPDDWGFDEAWMFAKHFFELGFNVAQKGE